MATSWLLVAGAIVAEIAAALLLRRSDGFSRWLPATAALCCFGAAFYVVSLALTRLPMSVVYPVWAGGGTAGVAVVGMLALKEGGGLQKVSGIALVVAGIALLNAVAPGS